MSIGNSILRGTRFLYNENWIIDFQGISSKYRESGKAALEPEYAPDWIDTLTVREQDISSRLMNLEPNDLVNIAAGRLSEFLIDRSIIGAKSFKNEDDLENLLKNMEQKAYQVINKHLETKPSQEILDARKEGFSDRFRSNRKSMDISLKKDDSDPSIKPTVKDPNEDLMEPDFPDEILLGNSFSEGLYREEWKRPALVRDLIRDLDKEISEKYATSLDTG